MKILIAEDNEVNRLSLKAFLEKLGHEVVACENGQQVLEKLFLGEVPQLVFLDWMMPGASGLEVCKKIRTTPNLNYTYIVLVTAKTEAKDVIEGLRAGANDYLPKPVNCFDLEARVRVAVQMIEMQNTILAQKAKLIESEKLANLGEISAGMAQEFKPFLVQMRKDLERLSLHFGEQEKRTMVSLSTQMSHIEKIIDLLKSFSQDPQQEKFQPLTFREIVALSLSFVGNRMAENKIDFRVKNFDPFLALDAQRMQLSQMLYALLVNSIEAIRGLPERWIELEVFEAGENIHLALTDSGFGISDSVQAKMWQPFFSTKKDQRHSGLGLNIVKNIAESHGGSLRYDEKSSRTRFIVTMLKVKNQINAFSNDGDKNNAA